MNDLITITDAALKQLKDANIENKNIRIYLSGGGCSGFEINMDFTDFTPDEEFDLTFKAGDTLFIIDVKSASYLNGATLDYGGSLLDKKFKWSIPNSTSSCGCGFSFGF